MRVERFRAAKQALLQKHETARAPHTRLLGHASKAQLPQEYALNRLPTWRGVGSRVNSRVQSRQVQARAPRALQQAGTRPRAAGWTNRTAHSIPRDDRGGGGRATYLHFRPRSRLSSMGCHPHPNEALCGSTAPERLAASPTRLMTTRLCCRTTGGPRQRHAGEVAASLKQMEPSGNLRLCGTHETRQASPVAANHAVVRLLHLAGE